MAFKVKLPKGQKNTRANQLAALKAARPQLAKRAGGTYNPATGRVDPLNPQAHRTALNQSPTYLSGMAGLAGAESRIKSQYGFDPGYQADPFSQAALLKKHYEQARAGTNVSQAARGNLYSSALRNALTSVKSGYEQNVDAARKAQESALADIAQQRSDLTAGALEDTLNNPPPAPKAPKKRSGLPRITPNLLKRAGVAPPSRRVVARIRGKRR